MFITAVLWHYAAMPIAQSRLTAQGQISVPATVRRKLGLGPGSILEWEESGDTVVVRRGGRFSSADVHAALFDTKPAARGLDELKAGIRRRMKTRYARR